jgi:hypothetical protein
MSISAIRAHAARFRIDESRSDHKFVEVSIFWHSTVHVDAQDTVGEVRATACSTVPFY